MKTTIGVLASGGGTNLQSIIDHIRLGILKNVEIGVLICNNPDAYALKRAEQYGIPREFISHVGKERKDFDREVSEALERYHVDLILLAGWMRIISPGLIDMYPWRMMNLHPALLPFFGGKGMYGKHVHRAVLESGMKVSGCTVHYVDKGVDTGPIILQHPVPVKEGDTVEGLANRILAWEHRLYPKAVQLHADERLRVDVIKIQTEGGVRERKIVRIDYSDEWEEGWSRRQQAYVEHQRALWLREFGKALDEV